MAVKPRKMIPASSENFAYNYFSNFCKRLIDLFFFKIIMSYERDSEISKLRINHCH